VDVLDLADELPEVKVKTIENLADFLGIKKLSEQTVIDETEYASYWNDSSKRSELVKFAKERAECIFEVFSLMFNYAAELSKLVGLPLDHVVKAAVGFRTEWYMIREAYRIGELIPERTERSYIPYAGGIVLSPKPGVHENVADLDIKSMYPSIMVEKNVSPDTYLQPTEPEPPEGVNVAPEVGYRFRKEPPGFYHRILTSLLAARGDVRERMKELNPRSEEYRLLDARQRAIKVITNAVYGYAGWTGARWFRKPVAEAAAAWGRETISTSIELAKELGLDVIYGDTDSIFVEYEPQKVEALCRTINERLGLEMKPDKIFKLVLFTEAKKRYCGLLPDGSLDMVGLEAVRGDWANVARDTQEKVLELVLKQRSADKAVEFVREYIDKIRKQKVPFRDLIIWKTLTKPAEKYEVNAPHVQAAKMLISSGWELAVGDKVGYVVTHGSGKLYERVKPYVFASYGEVDTEYYVSNQVVPAALRILSLFGVDEKALLEAVPPKQPRTLADFGA
jgi:DNA polymerase I